MENRHSHKSTLFGINLYALVAVLAIALAVVSYSYFSYVARIAEADRDKEGMQAAGQIMKNMNNYWKNLDKQTTSPVAPPQSDEPPPQLPKYGTP